MLEYFNNLLYDQETFVVTLIFLPLALVITLLPILFFLTVILDKDKTPNE
jgi:hypothetical protein